jgi:hypothetical protein
MGQGESTRGAAETVRELCHGGTQRCLPLSGVYLAPFEPLGNAKQKVTNTGEWEVKSD